MPGSNEIVHVNTVETTFEIGAPTAGRVKFPLTEDELKDERKAIEKIEKLSRVLQVARAKLGGKPVKNGND